MANQILYPVPGCVVEFMQGNRPVQAWVTEEQSGQLRLYAVNKREQKLAANRVLPWLGPVHGTTASRHEMQSLLEEHRRKREALAAELDLLQLWELAQAEVRQADARWFAELLWPDPDCDQVAGLAQAMLNMKTYFKFNPPDFEIYTAEQVAQREEKQRQEQERQQLAATGADFFRRLYEAARQRKQVEAQEVPEEPLAGKLRAMLLERVADPDLSEGEGLWKLLTKDLCAKNLADEPHLPLLLAVAWGILPEHHNFWLDRAGYDPDPAWVAPYAEEVRAVEGETSKFCLAAEHSGAVWAELPLVSIDPASTKDWDDALCVSRESGGYLVEVALACPALGWPFGGELDKAVLRRASSLYLPEGEYSMLPQELCLKAFSLEAGQIRPSLRVSMRFDADGKMLGLEPALVAVKVRANLTLRNCETLLDGAENPSQASLSAMLQTGYELALKLQAGRVAAGAVITERSDQEISLEEDGAGGVRVVLGRGEEMRRSNTLVGELMIAVNSRLAAWAQERALPLLYRTQDVSVPREYAGVWEREEDIARVLKGMPPSHWSVEPKRHAGVGADMYSSFTSPMRRYPDLLNQGQLVHFLQAGQARINAPELASMLPLIGARLDSVGQVQRYRPRYWQLLYLQQQEQAQRKQGLMQYWKATVTEENNHFVTVIVELPRLQLRSPRELFGERAVPGENVLVRLGKINPLRNELQIMEVREL